MINIMGSNKFNLFSTRNLMVKGDMSNYITLCNNAQQYSNKCQIHNQQVIQKLLHSS